MNCPQRGMLAVVLQSGVRAAGMAAHVAASATGRSRAKFVRNASLELGGGRCFHANWEVVQLCENEPDHKALTHHSAQ